MIKFESHFVATCTRMMKFFFSFEEESCRIKNDRMMDEMRCHARVKDEM